PESPLAITLAAALLKGDKFDLVVQKAVELGVTRVIPFISARCDIKPRKDSPKVERWRKIALEATKQCGRASSTVIDEPVEWSELISRQSSDRNVLMFSERAGGPLPPGLVPGELTVFVGPEGGWDDSEIERAQAAGAFLVTIGGRILRAETAAIALTAIVQNRFGDMN
ncbi:MAG: RsmE family RNA methyltransferase, partial [Acidobacteriota bacterium]